MSDERKEKVLHTRIPESLESEIKERANKLGVSVSNLVRNVLANTFEMVDDIMSDSANVARSAKQAAAPLGKRASEAHGGAAAPATGGEPRVLGWHELTLEINAVCDRCNDILARGTRAAVSVLDGAGPRIIRCTPCVKGEATHDDDAE